jgi:hypothetical protein
MLGNIESFFGRNWTASDPISQRFAFDKLKH